MTINSLDFVVFVALAAAAFHLAPGDWRARVVFPMSCLLFLLLTGPSRRALLAMFAFIAAIWLATRVVTLRPTRGTLAVLIGTLLLLFGWLKGYAMLSWLPLAAQVPTTIGLSFLFLRGLQLLVDMKQNPGLRPAAIDVFSFLASWPCLVSGPIQRFQDFQSQSAGMTAYRLDDEVLLESLGRMSRGWLLAIVCGGFFRHVWLGLKATAFEDVYPLAFGAAQLAFLAYLFCDFAGYTDVVIGAGRLFGLRLPENFNRPYAARSFLEFWGRWHMTMSNWFKTYVFNPLLMALTARWPGSAAATLMAAIAFFATFFLVGLWHGTTKAFILAGLLLGLGASVNQWYRGTMRVWLGKRAFESLSAKPAYAAAAKGLAFAYLCGAIMPLWMKGLELYSITSRYGASGLALSQAFVFFVAAATALVRLPTIPWPQSVGWRCFTIAGTIVIIEMYLFLFPPADGRFFYQQY
jgi:D-alanyl-lipoteichoic acid acyltransferase DltB (MBOAT superfamily)